MKAANILGSQAFLRGCYDQLKPEPGINFEAIDYGYAWENSFNTFWAGASNGIRAGLVIGIIAGGSLVLLLLLSRCW